MGETFIIQKVLKILNGQGLTLTGFTIHLFRNAYLFR